MKLENFMCSCSALRSHHVNLMAWMMMMMMTF